MFTFFFLLWREWPKALGGISRARHSLRQKLFFGRARFISKCLWVGMRLLYTYTIRFELSDGRQAVFVLWPPQTNHNSRRHRTMLPNRPVYFQNFDNKRVSVQEYCIKMCCFLLYLVQSSWFCVNFAGRNRFLGST